MCGWNVVNTFREFFGYVFISGPPCSVTETSPSSTTIVLQLSMHFLCDCVAVLLFSCKLPKLLCFQRKCEIVEQSLSRFVLCESPFVNAV